MKGGKRMNIAAIVGLGLVATILTIIMRQYKPEYAMFISLMAGVSILLIVFAYISPVVDEMEGLLSHVSADGSYVETLVKALGICYVTQIACDSCKDAGETAIAAKMELAGKVAIVILSLPMFTRLTGIVVELLSI